MSQVREVSGAVAQYGRFHRQFDRPLPVRVVTPPPSHRAAAPDIAPPVTARRDLPHLGRYLNIYA